jgi:L-aspartate oxidase
MKKFDFLVIGSGIAGLVYALEVSKLGKTAIVTKSKLNDCNTDYAQGGIAAVLDRHDSFEDHINDTFAAGSEIGKKKVIRTIVEEGPECIDYLIKLGTEFTTEHNELQRSLENLSLAKEGGHSQKRVAFAADSTGREIMRALISACKANKNISIFEDHMAIDLITQHHISQAKGFVAGITCWGAYILNRSASEIEVFRAKKTMLATGGASQVYAYNTNPEIATGDGIAMAVLAGARVANMEFVQFHPTCFYTSEGKPFLVSEALRGEGAVLRLQNGNTFVEKYHKDGSLAPRDAVSRAIESEMRLNDDKFVYLDATGIDSDKLRKRFPYIDRKCRKRGIDFTEQMIPVVPAAHYFCGGILTTVNGQTDIKNLFAAGEVACTGLHGANRLASNSLLESLVIAYRAGNHKSNTEGVEFPTIPKWRKIGEFNEHEWVIISHNKRIIKTIMQGYAGITRSNRILRYAANRISNIYHEINDFYHSNPIRKEVIETRNLAVVAGLIIRSALVRQESRGLHNLTDHPRKNDKMYKKDTII